MEVVLLTYTVVDQELHSTEAIYTVMNVVRLAKV